MEDCGLRVRLVCWVGGRVTSPAGLMVGRGLGWIRGRGEYSDSMLPLAMFSQGVAAGMEQRTEGSSMESV